MGPISLTGAGSANAPEDLRGKNHSAKIFGLSTILFFVRSSPNECNGLWKRMDDLQQRRAG
jgi:hypothetical protein